MEGCQSGRMGYPGKVVYPKGYREFESRSLRQIGNFEPKQNKGFVAKMIRCQCKNHITKI